MAKEQWVCRGCGVLGGLLLVGGSLCKPLVILQLFAFLPVFYLRLVIRPGKWGMFLAGLYMGLGYVLPQLVALRLPIVITLILLVHLVVVMIVLVCGSAKLISGPAVLGSFAVGAFMMVVDWCNFNILPMWGTAQSFVRPWSEYPAVIGFVSFSGITGIIFVIGTLSALAVNYIARPNERRRLLIAGAVLVLVCSGLNAAVMCERPVGTMKVGAVGWIFSDSSGDENVHDEDGFAKLYAEPVARAASAGARLVVSGEMGFYIAKHDRAEWLERFAEIAGEHNVYLVVGYFDVTEQINRLLFMNPKGQVLGEYVKTCLTPFENYEKGDGSLETIRVDGVSIGAMICQDDNFTRFSREYGKGKVSLVAVPTLDWETVKIAHMQNSIHRAIESRYAIVRAAVNGVSAIISAKGEVLARRDHFAEGNGVVTAEVDVYDNRTLYSVIGDWLVALGAVFVLGCKVFKLI